MADILQRFFRSKVRVTSRRSLGYDFKNIVLFVRYLVGTTFKTQFKEESEKLSYLLFNHTFQDEEEKRRLSIDMKVFENFINENEENSFLEELEPLLKKKRYESGHWDHAIKGYRETEIDKWNPTNSQIIEKIKKTAFTSDSTPLKHVHILDLNEHGVILPHIDNIKFCGSTIAGVSLLSDSIMRLVHDKNKSKVIDVLLKRRSLYVMSGAARYDYTHEILEQNAKFGDKIVKKNRRISIICRNEP